MNSHVRRQSLIEQLQKQPGMRVAELAEVLQVSMGTIRNDLNALELDGRLTRVYGGGILNEQDQFHNNSFSLRLKEDTAAKLAIAREAAG
jgi:DeoR/GlpR family transcriptional regulator of sugar metabolism